MAFDLGCPQLETDGGRSEIHFPSLDACIWSTDPASYKRLQSVAYINHAGANFWEVVALMLIYPLTVLLQSFVVGVIPRICSWAPLSNILHVLGDFLAATVPLTCAFSSPHLVKNSLIMHACVLGLFAAQSKPVLAWPRFFSQLRASHAARKAGTAAPAFTYVDEHGKKLRFVSEYRAVIMITTCIAILAVDFPALFPRSHAKTEEFGFSIMDLGTGSIILATAICSRSARGTGTGLRRDKVFSQMAALRPILALGLIRFIVLWGIDYHVPTSEYGSHWNFFFTIAVLSFVAAVADFSPLVSFVAGIMLLVIYQVFLSLCGGEYILHAPRVGPFSANREGILSCIGFLCIHWLGVALGAEILKPHSAANRTNRLLSFAVAGLVITLASSFFGVHASRRMCNLPYVTFIVGTNALVLGLLAWIDLDWPRPRPQMPLVYRGVQDSMFAAFMLANPLTGIINIFFQPLLIPAGAAMFIMLTYTTFFTLPFAILGARGVVLKFW